MHLDLPKSLQNTCSLLVKIKKVILIVSSLILAFTFLAVVVLRYFFEADLFAYEEWILIVAFWMYFMGGALGSYENSHIKADFLATILKTARARWLLINFTFLIEFIVCAVLSYWAFLMVFEEISSYPGWQRTSALQLPFFIPRLGIFLGFLLMTFYCAMHLLSGLRMGPTVEWEEEETPFIAEEDR